MGLQSEHSRRPLESRQHIAPKAEQGILGLVEDERRDPPSPLWAGDGLEPGAVFQSAASVLLAQPGW